MLGKVEQEILEHTQAENRDGLLHLSGFVVQFRSSWAYDYLTRVFWDQEHGGRYWGVALSLSP
jgi:hypothetical protein